jgi:ATP-dependent Zn protease
MDGALSKHGIITILTTNHPEKLDPALVREGRVDISLNVDNPSIKQVQEYLSVFYDQKVSLDSYPNDFPMTKIQEICMQNNLNDTMSILSK